ncbi:MAG: type II secretion system F family protein [Verrucomicrobiia bacterium]
MIVTPGQLNRRAELYHQLGSMIAAGVPLMKALEMASATPSIRASQKTILELIQHLQSGLTFSESMTRVQGWMPEFDIALLSVGEGSGRLDASFKLLANYYAARAQIIRDTIAGLAITTVTLHVFLLVFPLGLWIAFAQGILNNDYVRCLPFLIEKAAVFGVLYGIAFSLIYACQGKRGERWRTRVESVLHPVPLLGTARKYLALSRLASALEALIGAGVSIIKSWELAGDASGSPRLQREISGWKGRLESGATPADLINQSRCFPQIFANLYGTAEQSGKLDDALARLHTYFQEEGFRTLRFFTRLLNGTIYGLVVLLVAYSVIRFWLNYFSQISAATNGF